jgi:TolB protein
LQLEGPIKRMKAYPPLLPFFASLLVGLAAAQLPAQDWVHTGTNLGNDRIRIAAADFKLAGADPQTPALKATFDATLYSDLANAGIFDLVSKSLAPQSTPGSPQEINLAEWSAVPANAAMVAFGALSANNGRVIVYGWLFDTRNTVSPQVLGKQYNEVASQDSARTIAHRFADEIILRLGGGINGIAETKIYFVSSRTGSKEIWVMDYDGQNQRQVTHLGTISNSPRISPETPASPLLRWATTDGPSACILWTSTAWSPFRAARPGEATLRRPGPRTARRSPSRRPAAAIPRSGLPTRTAAICAS